MLFRSVHVTVWIVRDDDGNNAAYTENQVHEIISGVNRIYRQCATTFELAGAINFTNRTEWLNLTRTDGYCPEADAMLAGLSKNTPSGLKICLVNSMTRVRTSPPLTESLGGFNSPNGIVAVTGHPQAPLSPRVLGHEIGHAFGLSDIYDKDERTPLIVEGLVSANRLPLDWSGSNTGTEYYPAGLKQAELIQRLLMFGITRGPKTDDCVDIPMGSIYGLWSKKVDDSRVWCLGENQRAPVGLENMNRQPNHN